MMNVWILLSERSKIYRIILFAGRLRVGELYFWELYVGDKIIFFKNRVDVFYISQVVVIFVEEKVSVDREGVQGVFGDSRDYFFDLGGGIWVLFYQY